MAAQDGVPADVVELPVLLGVGDHALATVLKQKRPPEARREILHDALKIRHPVSYLDVPTVVGEPSFDLLYN
ncbi:hypothetical protein Psi02_53930 [Planotetraspora silvatica]|uniref:Uncharacterized protein n=1 Tax=Planotetraspora silvatica TaxID=234614 RepID=A0A8J3UN36_9ACTN|nr:hypothetical protein Psi02_53930 [Planotetraspora silvatica]